jgi:predicted acylesterase/phospholipase RssA
MAELPPYCEKHDHRLSEPCPGFECEDDVRPLGNPSQAALGIVLTGGGAFGAWEAGALEELFCYWNRKFGADPPIRLVVGTSTGALIAPFAALDWNAVCYLAGWYQKVKTSDIYAFTVPNLLKWQSLYDWGYPESACEPRGRLYQKYAEVLQGAPGGDPLQRLVHSWALPPADRKVVAATTIDFASGATDYVMNCPDDLPPGGMHYCSRFYDGVFASAVPPLFGPPTPIRNRGARSSPPTPHFDGGPYQEAPFDIFFEIQNEQKIRLTHIVLISSYPFFPGSDDRPAQAARFPRDPKIGDIAGRFDSVLSEASVTSLTRLACLTLKLHAAGHSPEHVRKHTGIRPPHTLGAEVPQLVCAFPCERMGFNPNGFDPTEMGEMRKRGREQSLPVFIKYF